MSLRIDDKELTFTKTTFPGGESCIRVSSVGEMPDEVAIQLDFESNSDLFDLALLVDAIRRKYDSVAQAQPPLLLFMPYAPYARQDRVCNAGESLSIKVVADFINALNFERVCIVDPHSDVTPSVFNNVMVVGQEYAAMRVAAKVGKKAIIVSPDAGASKKGFKFFQTGGFGGFAKADKVRDPLGGKIVATSVVGIPHIGDKDFLIVDDICDGGRTFTELAKVLRPLTRGKIMLYVTHGIFSAGAEVFDNLIDEVYTANPVGATGKAAVESGRVIRI